MKNLNIGARLAMGFDLILLLMAVFIAADFACLTSIRAATNGMIEKEWVKADAANIINVLTQNNVRNSMELLIVSERTVLAQLR